MHTFFMMSLFARNFFNKFRVTPIANVDVISNVVRLNYTQCYTCLTNSAIIQLETKKCTRLRELPANATTDRRLFSTLESIQFKNSLSNFLNKFFLIDKSKQQYAAFNWFRTLDQVNYQEFFALLKMEDTYFSWFKVTELHVWMLLVRLMQCGNHIRVTRTTIIEAMWIDVEKRAKTLEPTNKNFKKNMRQLYERFKVTLHIYDEGFLSDDMVFAGALWFHFFEKNCDDPSLIEALISYIRYQINYLQMVNAEEEGKEGEIKKQIWTSFKPHTENVK